MTKIASAIAAIAILLAGCSDSGEPDASTEDGASAEQQAVGATVEPAVAAQEPAVGATIGVGDVSLSSAYTDLNIDSKTGGCAITDQAGEDDGEWTEWTCKGLEGIPLFVAEGDGRFSIDAGVKSDLFETMGPFNNPPAKVEWRLADGKPFAVIYRLTDATIENRGSSKLFIERIGISGDQGCVVARIPGGPDDNREARAVADTKARGFECGDI